MLIRKGKPVAVWTGSTNISAGGIFGHSNVGHAIWDEELAQSYLDYWERLARRTSRGNRWWRRTWRPSRRPLRPRSRRKTASSGSTARATTRDLETLHWYADVMGSAKRTMCMTFAFNLDDLFFQVLKRRDDTLRYAVFDDNLKQDVEDQIDLVRNTVIAAGAKLETGDFEEFLGEELTGFNRNQYIHTKFMLVDPLGDDPVVVTGSANFSQPRKWPTTRTCSSSGEIRGSRTFTSASTCESSITSTRDTSSGRSRRQGRAIPRRGSSRRTRRIGCRSISEGRKQLRRLAFMGACEIASFGF